MRISDWSSDVCSSDLARGLQAGSQRGDEAISWAGSLSGRQGDLADLEHPAILAHAGGQRPDPEMRDQLAVLVEVKAPLPRLHQLQRCALGQDELGARRNPERPGELVRIVAIEKQEVAAQRHAVEREIGRASCRERVCQYV